MEQQKGFKKKTSQELTQAMKITALGMWEWSLERDEVYLSEETFAIVGVNPDQFDHTMTYIVGKVVHSESRIEFMKSMALGRKEGLVRNKIYRVNHPDKNPCWVKFYSKVIKDQNGNASKLVGTLMDVTEEYLLKRRLMGQVTLLESVLEALPTPVFYKNREGVYQFCNDAFANFFGKRKDEVVGHTVEDVALDEAAELCDFADQELLTNEQSQVFESKLSHGDHSIRNVLFSRAPYRDYRNSVKGIVGVMQDITNQKAIEREVEMLYEAKDVFLTFNREMMSYRNTLEFLNKMLSKFQQVFKKSHLSSVLELNEEGSFSILANNGYDAEEVAKLKFPVEESFMWRSTGGLVKKASILNDISELMGSDERIFTTMSSDRIESTLIIPVYIEGRFKWLLSFDSNENHTFDDVDMFVAEYIREELPIAYRMFELYQKTLKLSRYDGLTGLMNRRYFEYTLEETLNRSMYNKEEFSVLLFDLDGLKRVNDTYGHHAGDIYIRGFVEALKNEFFESDILARIGGDEFTGIFVNVDLAELIHKIEQIRQRFEDRPLRSGRDSFNGSFSYGLARFPSDSRDMSHLLRIADENMYKDKQRHRIK